MERNTYIDNIDVELAKKMYYEKLNIMPKNEEVKVIDSLDRVTIEAVTAKVSSPNYNAAAMDGIAVKASNTIGAMESNPLTLKIDKDFIYINTGNQIKEPYDSVIIIEDVIDCGDGNIQILKSAHPWQDRKSVV